MGGGFKKIISVAFPLAYVANRTGYNAVKGENAQDSVKNAVTDVATAGRSVDNSTPEIAATPPDPTSINAASAAQRRKQRVAAAYGYNSTIRAGSLGSTLGTTSGTSNTLLGS